MKQQYGNRPIPWAIAISEALAGQLHWLLPSVLVTVAVLKIGLVAALGLALAVPVVLFFDNLRKNPVWIVWMLFGLAFFSPGLSRYAGGPWGLMVDGLLVAGLLLMVADWRKRDFGRLNDAIFWCSLAWFGMVLFQLVNPRSIGASAWFYAMRAMGFYQVLTVAFVLLVVDDRKTFDRAIHIALLFSLLGTLWGLKQQHIGLDAAENHWLYAEGNAMTHVLAGVLRVFSFYSDAGQFGASQAMFFTLSAILALGPFSMRRRLFYGLIAVASLVGFGISGTRGALAVPAIGAMAYLVISRNVRVLSLGLLVMGAVYYFLKFTFALQHIEQVRRMRTALDPNDPSLLVRHANQNIFAAYLADKPFGGGIGCVGFWGNRFRPGSFLASMPTDSYFVKVWVEMGIVGVAFHLFILGFLVGRIGAIIWSLRDPLLRQQCSAILAALCGILMASYGNQVFSQIPTSLVLFVFMALVALSPRFDKKQ